MRVSIMQPAYLPWAGYIQRVMRSDLHIVMDDVKIDWRSKTQFTNRNRIPTSNGPVWLTIPLLKADSDGLTINRIHINNSERWARKHFATITQNYSKSLFYKEHSEFFSKFYNNEYELLVDAIGMSTDYLLTAFGCTTRCVKSSQLKVEGKKDELVLNLCKEVGATSYISGPFGRDYLNLDLFEQAGIEVVFHDFFVEEYSQVQPGFTPYMSCIDMLFCLGGDKARQLLL